MPQSCVRSLVLISSWAAVEKVPLPENNEVTDENVYSIMQNLTSLLEKYIRRYPGQYFWTHRRWKTVPDENQLEKFRELRSKFMDKSLLK